MKKLSMALFFVLAGAFVGAESKPAAKKAGAAPEIYTVDTQASSLKWLARKVTGSHNGTVPLQSGSIQVTKGAITGGSIVANVAGLTVVDIPAGETNDKLSGHLKSDDFFGVAKHPTAAFKISSVSPLAGANAGEPNHMVVGDLTIKGATRPLAFPATITVASGKVDAVAKDVKIDRTQYDIRYGSGKFFQGLGDKAIYDEFTIDLHIVAKK